MHVPEKKTAKKLLPAAAVVLVFLLGMGVTLALLQTPTEQRANVFAAGEVTIELDEDEWDDWDPKEDPDGRTTRPGRTFSKDPVVTNTGDTSAYIYLEVQVPKAEVRSVTEKAGEEDEISAPAVTPLFTYSINGADDNGETEGWIALSSDNSGTEYDTHLYGYSREVPGGGKTIPLFETVTFANVLEGDITKGTEMDMPITAYAIQSGYLNESGDTMKLRLADAFTIYQSTAQD